MIVKRKFFIPLAAVAVIGSLAVGAYAVGETDSTWTKIGDGYYSEAAAVESTVVLQRSLTDADYAAIKEQLIDTSKEPDLVSAQKAKDDPDAILPYNMLPDGRFLKDNWVELEKQLMAEYQQVLVMSNDGTYETVSKENGQKTSVTLNAKENVAIETQRVQVNGKTFLLPNVEEGSALRTFVMPNGKNVVVHSEQEMWLVSEQGQPVKQAVSNTYQGKSYDALVKESFQKYRENAVLWCGQVTPSPDSEKIAFAANKNDLDGGYSVFLYDVASGQELLIRPGNGYFYLIAGWVDKDNILCYKMKDEACTFVVVGTDGSETKLQFAIPEMQLIAVKNGMIAYTNPANDMVYVGKYEGTEKLSNVYQSEVGGSLRLRTDVNEFNSDASKLALVYVSDGSPYRRAVKIFDLNENGKRSVRTPQKALAGRQNVLEASWTVDDELLIVAEESKEGQNSTFTTWQYKAEVAQK